jgi:sigma-B regulation protein RsbU (phosphoserine phosphatase)
MTLAGSQPQILLRADGPVEAELRAVLERGGWGVRFQPLEAADPDDAHSFGLILIDCGRQDRTGRHLCRRLRQKLVDSFVPVLCLTEDADPAARLAILECGADACLPRPFAPEELLAQVRAFLRLKDLHDRLTEKTAEVQRINKRLQQAYQQIDEELELARRLQRSFLPQSLPEMPPARFAVCYRPCGRVGGDFYDVFRLDEDHLGFYVADAMGHGVPASLLTIFVKKGVRAKEIFGQQYRLLPPDEVLQRLNRDLIDQALSEHPFITMVYALLNCRDRTLRFARAGHPYPLYVPHSGDVELWEVHGTLLGIFDTEFATQSRQLWPGDKVVFYTDGVEHHNGTGATVGAAHLLKCATRHRSLPVDEFVEQMSRDLPQAQEKPADDFTLLGLEVKG